MTNKQIKKLHKENKVLWAAISDTIWMAIRYAHGRNTYAPSMVRDAVRELKKVSPGFKLKDDRVIEAPTHKLKGIDLRDDYLDDLFERRNNDNN